MGKSAQEDSTVTMYAFIQSEYLSGFAKSTKELAPSLKNIYILDDKEYENLVKHYLGYLSASNVPVKITGACYLKLIFENDHDRFRSHIFKYIADDYDVSNNFDDYNDIFSALRLCDFDLFKQYLISSSASVDEEIKTDANDYLNRFDEAMSSSPSYKHYCEEYDEFKIKLGI